MVVVVVVVVVLVLVLVVCSKLFQEQTSSIQYRTHTKTLYS
jgi:hypothetical protein